MASAERIAIDYHFHEADGDSAGRCERGICDTARADKSAAVSDIRHTQLSAESPANAIGQEVITMSV